MDLAALITAVAGAVAILGGLWISRRGQRDTAAQQQLADSVTRDHNRLAETQQALDGYETLIGMLQGEVTRAADSHEQMRASLGLEREGRVSDGLEYGLIETRCRRQSGALASALSTLASMPVGETAMQVIARARDGMTNHPHTPQPMGDPYDHRS